MVLVCLEQFLNRCSTPRLFIKMLEGSVLNSLKEINASLKRFGFSMEISLESNKDYRDELTNVKELLAQGITPFPYKVAKALDQNTYRNIEFDIWNDYRRELKFGWYRNNGEFQVGVKCLVKLNPERNFHAHIQEMSPDKGPVIVFVEELGEKFIREQMGNQQMQMAYQGYAPENFNNMQNYNNVTMEMPAMHAPLMMEQPNSTSNPAMSQAMMIFSSPSVNANSNIANIQTQSAVISSTTPERTPSPLQQPDSTTDGQNSQQPSTDAQIPVDTSLCNQSSHLTPSQYVSYAPYSNPRVGNHAPMPAIANRPETSVPNPGIVNSPTCFTDTCSNTSALQQVICNTGVNMNYTNIPGGQDQQPRDMNSNILFQPVNFLAQKSLQISGNSTTVSEDLYQYGQEVSQNYVMLNDQSSHVPCEENKAVCYHSTVAPVTATTTHTNGSNNNVNNGENEASWQSKQVDVEGSRSVQKGFNNGVTPRINNNNSYDARSHQNPGRPNEQCEMQTVVQQPQDFDVCGRTVNEAQMPVHGHSMNIVSSTFNVPPPTPVPSTMPYTFSPIPHPTMYSPSVVPFYYPVESEQNIVPLQYYPQYTISPPVQLAHDTTDSTLSATDAQTAASSHMTGTLCQMQQSGNIESGCFTSCAVYSSSPPAPGPQPLIFQQPSGLFSAGTAPVANIQVPRWMQTATNPPHMAPTPCIYQPQTAAMATTSMGFNSSAV
ncbi:hypothetical protein C0J52_04093 [Blattella germanica]|nr:hypothetical protein C0J52_04093 [Blattella germanica]